MYKTLDNHGYAPEDILGIEKICDRIYTDLLADQEKISGDGTKYLPRKTVGPLVQGLTRADQKSQTVYLAGLSAGVIFRTSDRLDFVEALNGQDNPVVFSGAIIQLRDRLLQSLETNPAAVVDRLVPDPTLVESLDTLEGQEKVVKKLLGDYTRERIAPIIDAKKKSMVSQMRPDKTGDMRPIKFSDWSLNYEDPYWEQAQRLLLESGEPVNNNRVIQKIASRIGQLEIMRTVLNRDLEAGRIPVEINNLILTVTHEEVLRTDEMYGDKLELDDVLETFFKTQAEADRTGGMIRESLESSVYWQLSGRRQEITPDRYKLTTRQFEQVRFIALVYNDYFAAVTELYTEALARQQKDQRAAALVERLEGGLEPALIPYYRSLMQIGGTIESLRFDLIPDNGWFRVGEAQIISGGTPPAILYRRAFEQADRAENPVGRGILPAFLERVYAVSDEPLVVTLYSDRPYSSDISRTTSWAGNQAFIKTLNDAGVRAEAAFATDIERRSDGRLVLVDGRYQGEQITTLYNRIDYVSPETAMTNLRSPALQKIHKALKDNNVDMFPRPLPLLMGKGVYALLWDEEFAGLLDDRLGDNRLAQLRSVTPETRWIVPDNRQELEDLDPADWVRKGAYQHATRGLVMGAKNPAAFKQMVQEDLRTPYSAVVQRYIESDAPNFLVKRRLDSKYGSARLSPEYWVRESYRLRVEPTCIGNEVCEILVTGNPDRIVHGRENSIMTIAEITV